MPALKLADIKQMKNGNVAACGSSRSYQTQRLKTSYQTRRPETVQCKPGTPCKDPHACIEAC